mgnify:FL=1
MKQTIIVALMALLLLAACAQEQTALNEPITVGVMLPLTGPHAVPGEEARQGVELALEEVGDRIKVTYEDHAGDTKKAVAGFSKLVDVDGVNFVLTSQSWISNGVYPLAADKGVWQGAVFSTAFKRTRDADNAVLFTSKVDEDAPFLASYAQRFDRVGLMYLNNDFGKVWYDNLRALLGEKLVAAEAYDAADPDTGTQLSKIKATNPDLLIILGSGNEGGLVARKARELGINAQFAGMFGLQQKGFIVDPAAVEGTVYTYPFIDDKHPLVATFFFIYWVTT